MDLIALRRACERLTPASLRLRSEGPRHLTFLSAVEMSTGHHDAMLTLEPLGCVAIAPRASLDFQLDGRDLWLSGRVECDGTRARMTVRRAPLPRPERPSRLAAVHGMVVATFVPESTGLGRCFAPILDLGPHTLRLESSVPFAPGTRLRNLTVTHRMENLRHADGTVLDCSPVIYSDGHTAFQCGVRLRHIPTSPHADDPADTFEIRDHDRVRAILWALCDLEYEVSLRCGSQRLSGRLLRGSGGRDTLPELACRVQKSPTVTVGTVQVECALFGSGYRFFAKVQRREGHTLHLLAAPVIRESHRREEERVVFAPSVTASVRFRHPLEPEVEEHPLTDMSATGFGFHHPRHGALWTDLPLSEVSIQLPGLTLRPSQVEVRSSSPERCGVAIGGIGERDAERLRIELLRMSDHPATLHDGEDLDGIRAFHERVNLLEPAMAQNLAATWSETKRTWRLAHHHPDGLMRTTVGSWKGEIASTANVVRAYDNGWILQHIAATSPAVPASLGLMYTILLGLITPRPDCEYLSGFASDDFKSLRSNWSTFAEAFSTPQFRGATACWLYAHDAAAPSERRPGVRLLEGVADETLVENAAQRVLDPVCARALGLQKGQLKLSQTARAFADVGIERGREAWGAFRDNRCAAVLVREWASPGLSLSSLLSSAILLPGAADADPDGALTRALCDLLRERPVPGDPPLRFLYVPKHADQTAVEAAGFRRVGGCVLFACHRIGLREFHRFFAARYGFLQARMSHRRSVAA